MRKGLEKELRGYRGILGVVVESGVVNIGDEIKVIDEKYAEVPFVMRDRVEWLIKQIPEGKVIKYKQIIESLGLQKVYFRVLPSYLKSIKDPKVPIHRVVDSEGRLLSFVENQKELLEGENIRVVEDKIFLDRDSYDFKSIYYT